MHQDHRRISGGAGIDEVAVNAATVTTGVTLALDNRANDGRRGQHANVLSDVENLNGTYGRDRLVGRPGVRNRISGAGGGDVIIVGSRTPDRDRVICAAGFPGYDVVFADALDRVAIEDSTECDEVHRS